MTMGALLAAAGLVHAFAVWAVLTPRAGQAYVERYVTRERPCYHAVPAERFATLPARVTLDRPDPMLGRCSRTFALRWHWPEVGSVWSAAPVSELAVFLDGPVRPTRLQLHLGMLGGEKRPRGLRVLLNGQRLLEQRVSTDRTLEFELALGGAAVAGENRLRFELDAVYSPWTLFGLPDHRQLGVKLTLIEFE